MSNGYSRGIGPKGAAVAILSVLALSFFGGKAKQELIVESVKEAMQDSPPIAAQPSFGNKGETMSPAGYADSEPSIKVSTFIGGTPIFIISQGVYGDSLVIPELEYEFTPSAGETLDFLSPDELSQLGISSSEIFTNTAFIKSAAFTDSGEPTLAINQLTIDTDENGMPAVNVVPLPLP